MRAILFCVPVLILCSACSPSREAEWNNALRAGKQAVEQRNFREAITQFNLALNAAESFEPADKRLTETLDRLAEAHVGLGELGEAEQLYRRSLPLERQFYGNDSEQVATTLRNIGTLYQDVGRVDEADAAYKEVLAMLEKIASKEHPDYATALMHLAALRQQMGREVESQSLYQQALGLCQKTGQQRCVATIFDNLGSMYFEKGRLDEAADVFSKGRAAWQALAGKEHLDYAISTANLARVYQQQKKFKDAEPLLKQALPIFEMAYGNDGPELVGYYMGYSQLLRNLNQDEQAEAYERKASVIQALNSR